MPALPDSSSSQRAPVAGDEGSSWVPAPHPEMLSPWVLAWDLWPFVGSGKAKQQARSLLSVVRWGERGGEAKCLSKVTPKSHKEHLIPFSVGNRKDH